MRPLIVGNWKMNGLTAQLADIVALAASMRARPPHADVLVFPPFTLIERAVPRRQRRPDTTRALENGISEP